MTLVAEWKFNDGSGTTLTDTSGNGHNGTLGGGSFTVPTWVSGGGLLFDGVNNGVVVPDNAAFHLPNAHSVVAVFNWTSGNGGIYDKTSFGNTNSAYQIFVEGNDFKARTLKGGNQDCVDPTALTGGTQYTFVYNYDGVNMKVYRNGVLTGTHAVAAPVNDPIGDVFIGHLGSDVFPFKGTLYYLAVYNTALSPDEIADLVEVMATAERTITEYTAADVIASGLRTETEYTDNTVRASALRTIVDYTAATSIVSALRTIWEYDIGTPVTPPGDTGLPPPPPVEPCPDTNLGQGPPVPRGCEVQIGGIPTTGTPLTYGVAFRLYRKDCEIRMKNWGAIDSYSIEKPFGGESFERGAEI